MYFEAYNGERYFVFFGAVSKCKDIFLAPESATSSTITQRWWCTVIKCVLRNVAKFTGKSLCQIIFLIELQASGLQLY